MQSSATKSTLTLAQQGSHLGTYEPTLPLSTLRYLGVIDNWVPYVPYLMAGNEGPYYIVPLIHLRLCKVIGRASNQSIHLLALSFAIGGVHCRMQKYV